MTTQDTWSSLVPGDQMQPFQDIWNTLSRRSIFPVADNTERDDVLIPWLATKGMEAPSTDNPLYVHNKSLPVGAQLESTVDGSSWSRLVAARGEVAESLTVPSGSYTSSASLALGSVSPQPYDRVCEFHGVVNYSGITAASASWYVVVTSAGGNVDANVVRRARIAFTATVAVGGSVAVSGTFEIPAGQSAAPRIWLEESSGSATVNLEAGSFQYRVRQVV